MNGPVVILTTSQDLAAITDESIYSDMQSSDYQIARWTYVMFSDTSFSPADHVQGLALRALIPS